MAERMTSGRVSFEGSTTFNGLQGVRSDVLLPTLTVRETLQYSADLRLPPPTTEEERKKVVDEVILELGLKECANTRIGNHQHKGCSGGEKRRTSIGVQLLSNPSVLFLDEPTTGLDATSAFQLIRTLKTLAQRGRTIVTTIHQPRSEIWGMFDGLVILTRGSPVFSGSAESCLPWFNKVEMEMPDFVNPAEFLIDVAAVDNRSPELEAASLQRVDRLKTAWALESDRLYTSNEKATTASRNFAGASLIANLGYTVQSMACGFFVQANEIPVYVRWTKWTAYVFYSFGALASNEFVGSFYDCPLPGGESNPACAQYTGAFIMDSLGFPGNWLVRPIIILLAFVIMFYTCAWIGLRFLKVDMNIAKARHSEEDLSFGKERMTARSVGEVRTIDIGLDDFALDLDKRNILGQKQPKKTILYPVTAQFKAGSLNVIMGPSGSGKTSLLNSMALRLNNSFSTRYRHYGNMTFNGAIPTESVIRSVCSYVCQDDDALLPSLTVRETLRFAAGLRLPSHMTKQQKHQRAEEVLLKLGLKDCANNLIGSDMIKGISGGEKRRVSIAVQILTDPQILFLDEPTSGLDAFTASSILEVLEGLASEGRTLVLTIHQARSDLFAHFGNVLLLARGGSAVYAGDSQGMLPYFDKLGFPCSRNTNPADFALDLITVDLQHSSREEASRSKVQNLIANWRTGAFNGSLHPTSISTPAELGAMIRKPSGFFSAYPILVHRAFINFRRQPPLIMARIMQVVGLAVILTLFFAPLKHSYFSVQTRLGFVQEFCAFYFVGMLQNVAVYPIEKDVFYREDDDGTYGVEAFFAQYLTLEVPFEIISSFIFAIFVDLAAGLPRTVTMFFVCVFNCFCIVSCGESAGIMFNTLFAHTGFAINITSLFLGLAQVMSGVMSINMPAFLKDMNYLSPLGFAMRNLAPYSVRDIMFTCEDYQRLPNGACPITTGKEVLDLYKLDTNPRLNLLYLGICTIVYRLLAYALLKAARMKWGVGRKIEARHEVERSEVETSVTSSSEGWKEFAPVAEEDVAVSRVEVDEPKSRTVKEEV
ncbi:putative Uncharacterized ABC transporter ATP-binding protein/permease [Glarea lozoyensis 74030]|uniref:Putative Uncharacterized ABC transporter ATP-binding protein/permease n=1 Tax=Glarea lozoyensis (strain ATCC 74030 / MF5533) TaxID=1104152 RepID=H0EH83_GLAL7|nr:putative Uncharacterized ABC transporter ATP-binding protein/permease [Glarea lozoyensis 74030]